MVANTYRLEKNSGLPIQKEFISNSEFANTYTASFIKQWCQLVYSAISNSG